jgi:hypothetical protein
MVKKSLTLFERIRRLKRIIRYLHKRGTLFRSKAPENKIQVLQPKPRKKKIWRPWRKIKYLARKGSLFRRKRGSGVPKYQPSSSSPNRKKRSKSNPYLAYRRVRFLINTGRLFSRKIPDRRVKKKKRRTLRKIRYLLYRGSFFKVRTDSFKSFWKNYLRTLLKPEYLMIIINSTVLFLLAYLFVFTLLNFTSSLSALTFEIKSNIYYYNISYLVRSRDWTTDAIKVVYSSGPFLCLIFSLIVIIIYINISQETWFVRLLLFWIFCHAFIHFFGEMLIGTILMKGFGLSIVYMFLIEYKKLLIILGSSFFLIFSGFVLTKMALFSGNTYFNMLTHSNRSYFLHSQFLIPYLLGYTILILIKSPEITRFDVLVNLTMFFIILPLVIRGRSMKDMYFDPEIRKIRIRWIFLLITTAALLSFRVFFGFGVRIG